MHRSAFYMVPLVNNEFRIGHDIDLSNVSGRMKKKVSWRDAWMCILWKTRIIYWWSEPGRIFMRCEYFIHFAVHYIIIITVNSSRFIICSLAYWNWYHVKAHEISTILILYFAVFSAFFIGSRICALPPTLAARSQFTLDIFFLAP